MIEWLIHAPLLEPDLLSTFLLTYRKFTKASKFFSQLCNAVKTEPVASAVPEEQPLRTRVFDILRQWISNYPADFQPHSMQRKITRFCQVQIDALDCVAWAQELLELAGRPLPPQRPPLVTTSSLKLDVLAVNGEEFAQQCMIFEGDMFVRVQPMDLLSTSAHPSSVEIMIERFNVVSGWVASSIVTQSDFRRRSSLLKKFIIIAQKCRSIGNYNTLMEVMAGLNNGAVRRLKNTWASLPSKFQTTFDKLERLMEHHRNYHNYRKMLKRHDGPCLPYFGVFLRDLTVIELANPDQLENGMLYFEKLSLTASLIRQISTYQNLPAPYEVNTPLQSYLATLAALPELQLYRHSTDIEPATALEDELGVPSPMAGTPIAATPINLPDEASESERSF